MRLFIKGMGTLGPFIKNGADACWLLRYKRIIGSLSKVWTLSGIVKVRPINAATEEFTSSL